MHVRAQLSQRVRRPVPPVRGLQDHLRGLPSLGHHRSQPLPVVEDPHRLQVLTGLGHPHDHRPAPMQIDTHDLLSCVRFAHRASFVVMDVSTPRVPRDGHEERRPRSFIASAATFERLDTGIQTFG